MDWVQESQAVIEDIRKDVKEIAVSGQMPIDDTGIYLNITTLDGFRFCIKMGHSGFLVAAREYDKDDQVETEEIYETPYALLAVISKLYTESFANRLSAAMYKLTDGE